MKEIHNTLHSAGYACYAVGGAVRNMILRMEPKDWDLATDAEPETVMRLFRRVIPTGIKHGTVTILYRGASYEITTFRIEGRYSDSRRPDGVEYTPSLDEDLKRRDFSINAMAVDIGTGHLVDPHDGRGDCRRRIVRAIGIPEERFNEDGLRILRAVRFAGRLDFTIHPDTLKAMKICVLNLDRISRERVRSEIEEILLSDTPSRSFLIMEETGILERILPELSSARGVTQKGYHRYDVFLHSLLSCDGIPLQDVGLRLAALLHDIGKPAALTMGEDGQPRFHGHEAESARIAGALMRRLKFPAAVEKRVVHLVREHMFNYEPGWTDAAVRRFIIRVGRENIEDILSLRLADQYGTTGKKADPRSLDEFRDRISRVLDEALSLKDLRINGKDLARHAGIPAGPSMGRVLDFLLESVVEDPSLNEREVLLEIAGRFYNSRIREPNLPPSKDPDR